MKKCKKLNCNNKAISRNQNENKMNLCIKSVAVPHRGDLFWVTLKHGYLTIPIGTYPKDKNSNKEKDFSCLGPVFLAPQLEVRIIDWYYIILHEFWIWLEIKGQQEAECNAKYLERPTLLNRNMSLCVFSFPNASYQS